MLNQNIHANNQSINHISTLNNLALRSCLNTLHLPEQVKVNMTWLTDNRNVGIVILIAKLLMHSITRLRRSKQDKWHFMLWIVQ